GRAAPRVGRAEVAAPAAPLRATGTGRDPAGPRVQGPSPSVARGTGHTTAQPPRRSHRGAAGFRRVTATPRADAPFRGLSAPAAVEGPGPAAPARSGKKRGLIGAGCGCLALLVLAVGGCSALVFSGVGDDDPAAAEETSPAEPAETPSDAAEASEDAPAEEA